jgi:hypothetical protein
LNLPHSDNNPKILHDHEIKYSAIFEIFDSPKCPENGIGANKDTRIEEDQKQTAETEHPQRSVTTLCSMNIPNSAKKSVLSNALDLGCRNKLQAEVNVEDADHEEDVLQIQTAFGMQTRSKIKTDINQTEIALNTVHTSLRADKAAFKN